MALSGETSVATLALPATNRLGPQHTLVLLVNFQNNPGSMPFSVATVETVALMQTSAWDLENSFQQTWLTGDVYGWFTIALYNTVCDTEALATLAKQAATNAGVDVAAYQRYVYAFPQTGNACAFWGLAVVGGTISQAWVNGGIALQFVAHEMGHNFGLRIHSNAMDRGTAVIGGTCIGIEYGDPIDMMGNSGPGHFNAFQKERFWAGTTASRRRSPKLRRAAPTRLNPTLPPAPAPRRSDSQEREPVELVLRAVPPRNRGRQFPLELRLQHAERRRAAHRIPCRAGTRATLSATPGNYTFLDGALTIGRSFTDAAEGSRLRR